MTRRSIRTLFVVTLAVALSACSILRIGADDGGREPQPPDQPEQFEFFMQPGTGAGPRAHELASNLAEPEPIQAGSATHLAQVETPIGHLDLVSATIGAGSTEMTGAICLGYVGRASRGSTCGFEPPEVATSGIRGWGSDGMWNTTELHGPARTDTMVVTVADGTDYTVHTHDRWAVLVWAAIRGGPESVQYFDADGVELDEG